MWLSERCRDPLIVVTAGTAVEGRPVGTLPTVQGTCGARVVLIDLRVGKRPSDEMHQPFPCALCRIAAKGQIDRSPTAASAHSAQPVRSATPQIMVPTAHDQFDNAARCKFRIGHVHFAARVAQSPQKPLQCALRAGILANLHAFRARVPFNIDGVDIIAGCVVAECTAR